jgi:hypothetical protein
MSERSMSDEPATKRGGLRLGLGALAILAGAGLFAWWHFARDGFEVGSPAGIAEASHEEVQRLCAVCHVYPPPDSLPRSAWMHEVQRGFEFHRQAGLSLENAPSQSAVAAYFEKRAPAVLPLARSTETKSPLRFERQDYAPTPPADLPAISNVRFVHYLDDQKLDVLACDMFGGRVLVLKPYEQSPHLEVLCDGLPQPGHVEVVDLDGDGIKDLLVANLGNFYPTNDRCGSVYWLRGTKEGKFTSHPLLEGVGRVADAQAADLNGDGKLDIAVAVFGWTTTGEVYWLENETTDYGQPKFTPRLLDSRHGAIHVPIGDINGDGRPDVVALLSQEHESVVAFLNDGKGQFTPQAIFNGPHPAFGSSGIQLVDFNHDGRLDVLYTNGDSLDSGILRPYHGVRWLENRGRFPFTDHFLAPLCGAHRALAADLDRDNGMDVVAVSFLPKVSYEPLRKSQNLEAMVVLKQTGPGAFEPHCLERVTCDYPTCDLGDFDGDGDIDVAIGRFQRFPRMGGTETRTSGWITILRNCQEHR